MQNEKVNIEYEMIISKNIALEHLYNKKMLDTLMQYTNKYYYLIYDKIYKNKKILCTNANKLLAYKVVKARMLLVSVELFNKNIYDRKFHETLYEEVAEKLTRIYEKAFIIFSPNSKRFRKKIDNEMSKIFDIIDEEYIFEPNRNDEMLSVLKSKTLNVLTLKYGSDIVKVGQDYVYNKILPKLRELRYEFVNNLGYYFPVIRFLDDKNLKDNEYQIFVRNQLVYQGTFEYENTDSLFDVVNKLKPLLIENVHKIFSVKDTYIYLEHVKKEHSVKVVENLLQLLDINDIKTIFCNLIQKEISIRDLPYVVENLANFARFDKDIATLTEKMIQVLK